MNHSIGSRSLVVNELHIGNATESVQTNTDRNQEVVLRRRSKSTGEFLVHDAVFRSSYIVLTIDEWLANTSDFTALLENNLVTLVHHIL